MPSVSGPIILGAPEVIARLAAVVAQVEVAGKAGVTTVGWAVIADAQRNCPVLSGRLAASLGGGADGVDFDGIKDDPDLQGPGIQIGTMVPYAVYPEFGTVHQAAQPYLRPALEAARSTGEAELVTTIRAGVPELG